MVTLPTLSLTILILGSGAVLFYHFYSQSIRDELSSTTNMMVECLDMTVRGDYKMEEDVLKKGNLNMSDSTMLYHVKEKSNIDTTIFWGNIRVLTTIEDSDGISGFLLPAFSIFPWMLQYVQVYSYHAALHL